MQALLHSTSIQLMLILNVVGYSIVSSAGAYNLHARNGRTKRTLLWMPHHNSRMQSIIGLGIPVDLDDTSITVGVFIKGNYRMPTNSTMYTNPVAYETIYADEVARRDAATNRWSLYEVFSHIADKYGLGGKACILRAICEAAKIPFDRKIGLLEEILHVVLTPTTTTDKMNTYTDVDYLSANSFGKTQEKCLHIYPGCKINLMQMFSSVMQLSGKKPY